MYVWLGRSLKNLEGRHPNTVDVEMSNVSPYVRHIITLFCLIDVVACRMPRSPVVGGLGQWRLFFLRLAIKQWCLLRSFYLLS
jgi:hypothetical protein